MKVIDRELLDCAKDGDLDGVVFALKAGADINIQDKWGYTALMRTAINNHAETADILIQAGADMNVQAEDGWTALMYAAERGHMKIAERLVQIGADPFVKNRSDRTASDIARTYGHIRMAELIEQRMAELKRAELAQGIEGIEMHDISRWL